MLVIAFASPVPRTDVPRIVKAADVFAMSSKSEGLPVSLLEAMALEKPVVCTSVGGIPGIIRDGENGLLVESGSVAALADGLTRLACSDPLRERFGGAACADVRHQHDVRVMVQRMEDGYRALLHECPMPIQRLSHPVCSGKRSPGEQTCR